jgi:metal-sulfur cluster biosynthetic enzyme
MPLVIEQVTAALSAIEEPSTGKRFSDLGAVKDVALDGGHVRLTVELPKGGEHAGSRRAELGARIRSEIGKLDGVTGVELLLERGAPVAGARRTTLAPR